MRGRVAAASLLLLAASPLAPAGAQQALPQPEQNYPGETGRTFRDSGAPGFRAPLRAPAGAPNLVLIVLDDVGFGQYSVFGGGIPSPALERLAGEGLRYTRFHTAGICSPTRAALLTGRNPHVAGFGNVSELSTGYDGYTGRIPRSTATVADVLRRHGYSTAMFGKNHNTAGWEGGPAGPFDRWPTALGFEYFYGFNGWGTSQWQPLLFENTTPVPPSPDRAYQLTADLVDHAIGWMRRTTATNAGRPYFLYLAPGATHAPHHAPRDWIERFRGRFDDGWDEYRTQTFARQKALGLLPADARLTPRPELVRAWDELSPAQRRVFARQMEVFAGFAAYTDHQVGRLLEAVRARPDGANTLVVYVVGDNGASAEGGPGGELNEIGAANQLAKHDEFTDAVLAKLGGPEYNNHFAWGWAWAMNTPFRYYKQLVSHLGATRNPLVVSWPARIKSPGVRRQFLDVTDLAPTLLEAAGVSMPAQVDGIDQRPLDGASMVSTFAEERAPEVRRTQYFEVFGNRGIYHDGWFASAPLEFNPGNPDRSHLDPDKVTWELYDLEHDFTQAVDLASQQPGRLRALQDLWWAEAGRNQVLPLDWRAGERMAGVARPNSVAAQKHFEYAPGIAGLPEGIAPNLHNRSWRIAASGAFNGKSRGMLITQGGMPGGWAFYVAGRRLVFEYNYGLQARYRIASAPLPATARTLEARFAYDGKGPRDLGAGGTITLWADGRQLGTGRLERTLPFVFSMTEGLDVGADYGSPVSGAYPFPFPFGPGLEVVTLDLD